MKERGETRMYKHPDGAKCYGYKYINDCITCARNKDFPKSGYSMWIFPPYGLKNDDKCSYKIHEGYAERKSDGRCTIRPVQ